MMDELIGQFLKSGAGAELLGTLKGHGLSTDQAAAALTATAQGVAHHAAGDAAANLGAVVTGLLGGAGGASGGLMGALGGLLGGAQAPVSAGPAGAGALGGLGTQVAQYVAQKTGLDPSVAQAVVSAALPKIMELLAGHPAAAGAAPAGGLMGALAGLLR